jgi:hypothetical protein
MSQLQKMLEASELGDVCSYSGRGMYGVKCLAISGVELGPLISFIVEAASKDKPSRDTLEALENIKQDSLGMGKIYYFPDVAYLK